MIYLPDLEVEELDLIHDFAEKCAPTNADQYARRGQSNLDKIKKDIITGKIGESKLAKYIEANGTTTSGSDLQIYKRGKKSWACDIKTYDPDLEINCKTQSMDSIKRYGVSWILQYGGNGHGHCDALFKPENQGDNIYFVGMSEHTIYCAMLVRDLFTHNLIKEPVLDWLKQSKRAVYYKDIELLPRNIRYSMLTALDIDFDLDDPLPF